MKTSSKHYLFKLNPYFSPKIWGWEKWNLSCHPNGLSSIIGGTHHQQTLNQIIQPTHFPILIKIIQANQNLSIQVHPDDSYAKKHENDQGKSECWYILEAEPDASLMVNFNQRINRQQLNTMLQQGVIESEINHIKVKPGDFIFIPAGTIHAIGKGIKLLEVQQSSDVTYRVHDYGRGRQLHIDQSLAVTDYSNSDRYQLDTNFNKFECEYFKVEKITLKPKEKQTLNYKNQELHKVESLTVINGKLKVNNNQNLDIILQPEESSYTNTSSVIENLANQTTELLKVTASYD